MPRTVELAQLAREDRWDGMGTYWVKLMKLSRREAAAWQEMRPGDGAQMPRAWRESPGDGFRWLRDGELVRDNSEARAISNAYHHGTGIGRRGLPEPGILDGITRHFELLRCECGRGGLRCDAAPVELALDAFLAAGVLSIDVQMFRDAATRRRA